MKNAHQECSNVTYKALELASDLDGFNHTVPFLVSQAKATKEALYPLAKGLEIISTEVWPPGLVVVIKNLVG